MLFYIEECSWSEWESWSSCTKTCGGGARVRARIAYYDGETNCGGSTIDQQNCNAEPCVAGNVICF